MKQSYTAVYRQDGGWWLGWVKEVPGVNCQERSFDDLKRSLTLTLLEALALDKRYRQSVSTFKDEMVIYEEDGSSAASAQA